MSSAASSLAQVTRSMHCASSSHVTRQSVCTPRCVHRDLVYPSVHLQRRLPGFPRRPLSPPMSVPNGHPGEDRFEAGDVEGTEASNHSSFLTSALLLGTTFLLLTANSAEAISDPGPHYHPVAADLNILAQNEDFWPNLLRYATYFFSVLLGTVYTALKPIGGLLKRPVTAVFTIAAIVGLLVFVSTTVRAMLGVLGEDLSNDLDYLLR